MKYLKFTLVGESAMLQHNPAGLMGGDPEGMGRKTIPTPEEEAKKGLYKDQEGYLYIPAVAVRNSMLTGSIGSRIGKRAAKGVLASIVSLLDSQERFPMFGGGSRPERLTSYSAIDIRRVMLNKKAGIVRARPRIDLPWSVDCVFAFDERVVGDSTVSVEQALVLAGRNVGLGDYRPEKSGWFGKFQAVKVRLEETL